MRSSRVACILFAIVLVVASHASAQGRQVLGIFDEPEMLHDFGTMSGAVKSIWVGLQPGGALDGSTGFEFSISGLDVFSHFELRFPSSPTIVLGSLAAPADTTTGSGGLNVAWPTCQEIGTAFLEVVLYSPSPPENHVLQVLRRFPPTNPNYPAPLGVPCDGPCFCVAMLRGESYVLNPTVSAESRSWGTLKQLYRR